MHNYFFTSIKACTQQRKNLSKLLPSHLSLGYTIALVLLIASGVFVELLGSEELTLLGDEMDSPSELIRKLVIARCCIFFFVVIVELFLGRMHTFLILIG